MALDKIVDSEKLDKDLTDVANAIRNKTGRNEKINFPEGFIDELDSIDVKLFDIEFEETGRFYLDIKTPPEVTEITDEMFSDNNHLRSIYLTNVNIIASKAFQYCHQLKQITINRPSDSISGAPWGAGTSVEVIWVG